MGVGARQVVAMRAWRKLIAHERRRQAPLEEKAHQRMYDTPPRATLASRRAWGNHLGCVTAPRITPG